MRTGGWLIAGSLIVCFLACVCAGCGGGETQATRLVGRGLDESVLRLEQDTSIGDVIAELGPPVSEVGDEARKELNYGTWQLSFVNGRLSRRSRVRVPPGAKAIPESSHLNQRVLGLHLGIAVRRIEKRLGIPEVIYEEFERSPMPIKTLRYGSWELTFRNGRLYQRAQ
jgi:hypothetical protein